MIDTHAHINHDLLKDSLDEISKDLDKFKAIICPSYDAKTCKTTLEFSKKYEKVFGALAIHPSETKDWNDEIKKFIEKNLENKKIVAIGEYGLDYHFEPYDKKVQEKVFLEQLDIAKQTKMPSIFHVRDAFDDFLSILKENLNGFCGGVVHCFDSDLKNAKEILDLDLMISFTGLITFKKRDELREVVKFVPLDRIMLETDSPFLSPEPFRGRVCVPSYVEKVYEMVAIIKNVDMKVLKEKMRENAQKFFKKLVI